MSIRVTAYSISIGNQQTLAIAQGEDREFRLTFLDPDTGSARDMTGAAAITLTVRNRTTGIELFSRLYSGFQGGATAGTPRFQILAADTSSQGAGVYECWVEWTDTSGYLEQLLVESTFEILTGANATAVTTPPGPTAVSAYIAGIVIQNDPTFGSPWIGARATGGYMVYSADGIGSTWAGTSVTPHSAGADSDVTVALNDVALFSFNRYGITTSGGFAVNPGDGTPLPAGYVAATQFVAKVGSALTVSSNTIAPDKGIHSVGAGLIKTITVPFTGFTGSIVLRPTAAFTYDATGNILGTGTAVIGRDMIATYDGSKWAMSY